MDGEVIAPRCKTPKVVRIYRLIQTWPLWYAGAAVVGLLMCLSGWISGRATWLRYGTWLTIPFVLLLANVVFVLAISAVVNLGVFVWNAVHRERRDSR
jgi:hypothetical protein